MPEKSAYTFNFLPSRGFSSITGKDAQSCLMQWSMKGLLHCQCFSFDETFKKHEIKEFATAFFNDPVVRQTLETEEGLPHDCDVVVSNVPCTLLSMDIFNRCIGTVTHKTGRIKFCFEEYCESLVVNDCLKRALCIQNSEFYDLFNETEREEFLFRLFRHIVIGGELSQPNEDFGVYTNFVKSLYRELISVQKIQGSEELKIVSLVYDVRVLSNNETVYPASKTHINTFAYLIVNPIKRHVIALSHVYGIGQF
ncbi:hypothetical protein EmuJ_000136200 [Echinococcus multilocularis]|uniref:Cilia- and flagella-associated protein 300 n=1 Tax=Echinococcus multilocularis TaxID=6211 RepID=A0A087VZ33_ECHMU|nr:hypothetical protein EmuJ_000136200 [Echinococcus multilocularis]